MTELADAGKTVLLETSGAHDVAPVDPRVHIILDLKCPDSGECDRNRWANLGRAEADRSDQVRDRLASRLGLDASGRFASNRLDERFHCLASAVFGAIEPIELAGWLLESGLDRVRLQLQLHKYIWHPTNARSMRLNALAVTEPNRLEDSSQRRSGYPRYVADTTQPVTSRSEAMSPTGPAKSVWKLIDWRLVAACGLPVWAFLFGMLLSPRPARDRPGRAEREPAGCRSCVRGNRRKRRCRARSSFARAEPQVFPFRSSCRFRCRASRSASCRRSSSNCPRANCYPPIGARLTRPRSASTRRLADAADEAQEVEEDALRAAHLRATSTTPASPETTRKPSVRGPCRTRRSVSSSATTSKRRTRRSARSE